MNLIEVSSSNLTSLPPTQTKQKKNREIPAIRLSVLFCSVLFCSIDRGGGGAAAGPMRREKRKKKSENVLANAGRIA